MLENSQMNFNFIAQRYKKEGSKRQTELFLKSGSVFSNLKKLVKDAYIIKTHTAVAAVRGTKFLTIHKKGISEVHVSTGSVSISSLKAKAKEKLLQSHYKAIIKPQKKIAVKKLSKVEQLRFKKLATHEYINKAKEKTNEELKNIYKKFILKENEINKVIKSLLKKAPIKLAN